MSASCCRLTQVNAHRRWRFRPPLSCGNKRFIRKKFPSQIGFLVPNDGTQSGFFHLCRDGPSGWMTDMKLSDQELLVLVGSFHRAWVTLLRDEHVTFDNIERVPALLVAAILGAAAETPLTEEDG